MPKTLLLADDSVTIQKVVGISFANEDVVLLTVDNGDDAVVRAREATPDLVLADIAMPGKDGYQVCEAIKSDPALRHVPVLLLSGTFESFDEARARAVGADGHITKPFEAQALVDRVNDLLARAESQRAVPAAAADTTVLVSERAPAGDAFDFFDEEFAETTPAPSAAATTVIADEPTAVHAMAGEPIELEAAVEAELEAVEAIPMAEDDPFRMGGQATVLFDPAEPPPVPTPAQLANDFATTRSGAPRPLLESDGGATRLVTDDEVGALDFGLDERAEAAVEARVEPEEALPLADVEADAGDDLFAADAGEPVAAPLPLRSEPAAPAASGAHLDALRGEIREQLEKVAWEAFGDLSERVVKETVARVEAIAWEVIPQLAETLIREEIRKLQKDE
jgi:CheY-like chemotaxis protein